MAKKKAAKRGRPSVDDKLVTKALRVRESQIKVYEKAATRAGLSLSQWVREALDSAAKR